MLIKQNHKFLKIANKINKKISLGKFNSSIKDYDELKKHYTQLKTKDVENKVLFENIRDQLLIYLKIKETENFLEKNEYPNLEIIKENINQLKSLSSVYSINKKLLIYSKNKLKYFVRIYEYTIYKTSLKEDLDKTYKSIWEEDYETALLNFPDIMSKFTQMEAYYKNDELYSSLMKLKSHIKTSLLANQAYSKIAKNN